MKIIWIDIYLKVNLVSLLSLITTDMEHRNYWILKHLHYESDSN